MVAGENVLVATRSGKLITIAAATGESLGYVQVPQSLRVAPAVDPHRAMVYQVADHTNVFIMSLTDHTCKNVAYVGHEPGTILTTPVVVDDFLLVAINSGAHDSTLNVFLIQPPKAGKAESWLKPVQQVELGGHVQSPPYLDGRRLLVTTSSGTVRIFQIGATGEKAPLHPVADAVTDGGENLVRFPLLQGGQFWIADNRLTKYDVQAAKGRLVPNSVEGAESVYLQAPLPVGPSVVTVRRKIGLPGAVVCAMPMQPQDAERQEGGLDHFWETELAAPLAAEPLLSRENNLFAVTARGTVFKIEPGQLAKGVLSQPTAVPGLTLFPAPVRCVVPLPGGLLAISSGKGSKQVGIYDPNNAPTKVGPLTVPDGHELACPPVALDGGVLLADRAGQVSLLDPATGDPLAERFQPALEPGTQVDWMVPAVVEGKPQVVLADGKSKIYWLGLQDEPQSHLEVLAQATVTTPIVSPLAVLGNTVYAGDAGKMLAPFGLPKLARGKERLLDGFCASAPSGSATACCCRPTTASCCVWTPTDGSCGKTRCRTARWPVCPCGSAPITCWRRGPASSGASTPPPENRSERSRPVVPWPPGRSPWAGNCSSADMTEPSTKCDNHEPREQTRFCRADSPPGDALRHGPRRDALLRGGPLRPDDAELGQRQPDPEDQAVEHRRERS